MRAWRLNELGDPWDVLSLDEVEGPVRQVQEKPEFQCLRARP